jgi:uncharacterized phage infection (PIP) family protein YhgE
MRWCRGGGTGTARAGRRSPTAPRVLRVFVAAAAAALLALGASACGGESKGEKWASSLCTSVSDWRSELQSISSDVQQQVTSQPSVSSAKTAVSSGVQQAAAATRKLRDELSDLGAPDTDAGAEAKAELDSLRSRLQADVGKAQSTLASAGGSASASELLTKLAGVASTLETSLRDAQATVRKISSLDPGGELQQGFEDADSCKDLRGNSNGE